MKKLYFNLLSILIISACNETIALTEKKSEFPTKAYKLNENGSVHSTSIDIEDFESSENCKSCHEDHYKEWSESMHAYAMKDPVFFSGWNGEQQKRHETGERFCIQCHNPVAFVSGVDLSGFLTAEDLEASDHPQSIKEGIGCAVCHSMTELSPSIHTEDIIAANAEYFMNPGEGVYYGSIENPVENDYHASEYNPAFPRSEACLPCHDITIRGVEAEITFTEWNRIPGLAMGNLLSCQECHMPVTTRPAAKDGPERVVHRHTFVGVDLDLTRPAEENPQIDEVKSLLENAVELNFGWPNDSFTAPVQQGDSLYIPITITSLTAHSLPSGVSFAREAWIELTVNDTDHNLLFQSGLVATDTSALDLLDSNLVLFTSTLFDENGEETGSVTDVHSMENNSLLAFSKQFRQYSLSLPEDYSGELSVHARMLFRSFKPASLSSHPDLLKNLPIIEMESISETISVLPL